MVNLQIDRRSSSLHGVQLQCLTFDRRKGLSERRFGAPKSRVHKALCFKQMLPRIAFQSGTALHPFVFSMCSRAIHCLALATASTACAAYSTLNALRIPIPVQCEVICNLFRNQGSVLHFSCGGALTVVQQAHLPWPLPLP